MRHLFNEYFSFTKKERKGIYILLAVIVVISVLPSFFHLFVKDEPFNTEQFQREIAALQRDSSLLNTSSKKEDDYYNDYTPSYKEEPPLKKEVFYFDPNTASANDWLRLGIRKRTAQTIQNYIAKGGKFYKPEDIKKIYGLSEKDAERLIPYVKISITKKEYPQTQYKAAGDKAYEHKKIIEPININAADSSDFIALPGIGPVLSKRIIAFRKKLGGFYSVDQIAETYNLPDSTFQKIKKYLLPDSKAIKKININSASVDEMKAHPYISYSIANAIFQYRQQHGSFSSVEDLKKIMTISDDFLIKVSPYLSVE